jgi:hypothetical protein
MAGAATSTVTPSSLACCRGVRNDEAQEYRSREGRYLNSGAMLQLQPLLTTLLLPKAAAVKDCHG